MIKSHAINGRQIGEFGFQGLVCLQDQKPNSRTMTNPRISIE
jgi:hypothetical protein